MNEADFWNVIGVPRKGTDGYKASGQLLQRLHTLSPEEIKSFYALLVDNVRRLRTRAILGAAILISCGHLDRFVFFFFRLWLISLGRAAFERAQSNPDTLASAEARFSTNVLGEDFDNYLNVAPIEFFLKTNLSLLRELRAESPSFSAMPDDILDLEPLSELDLRISYPDLWALTHNPEYVASCGLRKVPFEVPEATSPFLGVISRGSLITHRSYGPGYILHVMEVGQYLEGITVFEDHRAPMVFEDPHQWLA